MVQYCAAARAAAVVVIPSVSCPEAPKMKTPSLNATKEYNAMRKTREREEKRKKRISAQSKAVSLNLAC